MAKHAASIADLKPKPRNDAYTVLLAISLLAMIGACLMLRFDLQTYPSIKPTGADASPVPRPTASAAPASQPGSDPVEPEPPPMQ